MVFDVRKGSAGKAFAGGLLELGRWLDVETRTDGGPSLKIEAMISSLADATGAADATSAFTDAMANIVAKYGGGVVGYAAGLFSVTQLQIPSGVWLVSIDGNKGIIKQAANQFTQMDNGISSGANAGSTFNDTTKNWGVVNQYRDHTVEILAGTGAGQTRLIATHTATQLALETPWTVIPDATSTYRILKPKHLIVLDNPGNEFCGIIGCRLDGNKANQKSHNDLINLVNTGGGPTLFDTHHVVRDVIGLNPKGNGITIGKDVREARIINLVVQGGGRYGKYTSFQGGTDNRFLECTFASCALTGVYANGSNDSYVGCKVFGCGVDNISGNGAGWIISQPTAISEGEAQENRQRGFHVLNTFSVVAVGLFVDANGEVGILLDNSFDCNISGIVKSGAGLAYTTVYAVNVLNGADRNYVRVSVRSSELSGGVLDPTGQRNVDNVLEISERVYGRLFALGRAVAAGADEHFVFGKLGSPAASNPYFAWKTDASNPPKGALVGFDNTNTKTFIQADFANGKVILGDAGSSVIAEFGSDAQLLNGKYLKGLIVAGTSKKLIGMNGSDKVSIDEDAQGAVFGATITATGAIASTYGTKASTVDEHFRFGKASSPAAGNPYFVFKTDASATPIGSLVGWDGSTTQTFLTFDYANREVHIGQKQTGAPFGAIVIENGTFKPRSDLATQMGSDTERWGKLFMSDRVDSKVGTAGSTTNEHFRFGKVGNGAAGNPYFTFQTDASATPVGILTGFDGTNSLGFVRFDYGNAVVRLGDSNTTLRVLIATKNSAPAGTLLENESMIPYLDEAGNNLKFIVKYSTGATKTGTLGVI